MVKLLTSSCILIAGAISYGSMAPSITPLEIICGIFGSGAPIGTAPNDFRYQPPARVAVRILTPLRSLSLVIALRLVMNMDPAWACSSSTL